MQKNTFFLPFNWRFFALLLGAAILMSACLQWGFGAPPILLAIVLLTLAIGFYGFHQRGYYNTGAWVLFFYLLGNFLVALLAKTLMGQPLHSNLYIPYKSYSALALTTIELLAALTVVSFLPLGRSIFRPAKSPGFLSLLSWCCLGIALVAWLLVQYSHRFGGLSVFRYLLLMAVIARTALLLERSNNRRTFDLWLCLILATGIGMGLIENHKLVAALPVVTYFVTVFFFRKGLPARHVWVLVAGAFLFIFFAVPMIQTLRIRGIQGKSFQQRIEIVGTTTMNLVERPLQTRRNLHKAMLSKFHNIAQDRENRDSYSYYGQSGSNQALLERFSSVQRVDAAIIQSDEQGSLGGDFIWTAFPRLLPSSVFSAGPKYSEPYRIYVYYGLQGWWGSKHPVLPLTGQVYATYGFSGLLIIPFFTFVAFFIALKKLGWNLYRNVYAIFFFCYFAITKTNQADFMHFIAAVLRNFPLLAAALLSISLLYWFSRRLRAFRKTPATAQAG